MDLRRDFPILASKINGRKLAYLDNAATTQKPRQVIRAISDFYERTNSNVHRGLHTLSGRATDAYEGAREKVARFIGARSPREVIFTKNASEALNLLAARLPGRRVLATEMEHHSNLVPWQMRKGALSYLRFRREDGKLDLGGLKSAVSGKDIVTLAHVSNYLGTINPVGRIAKAAHSAGAVVVVDAAQSVPHMPVDVARLGADFIAFSGHKMCGPAGIGVLWGREELLEELPPFLYGGDMISSVSLEGAEWNRLPWKFEAGTPPIAGAVGLGAAVDYLKKVGMRRIRRIEESLTGRALRLLAEAGAEIYGPASPRERGGLVSFNLPGIHPHDVASILDREGIAIRSGHHCAEPVSRKLGLPGGAARASFYFYNTSDEIDRLAAGLGKVRNVFSRGRLEGGPEMPEAAREDG